MSQCSILNIAVLREFLLLLPYKFPEFMEFLKRVFLLPCVVMHPLFLLCLGHLPLLPYLSVIPGCDLPGTVEKTVDMLTQSLL